MRKLGWQKDKPDSRDKTDLDYMALKDIVVPESWDLTKGFTAVEDQGELGSCTANAAAGIVEYYEKTVFNKYLNLSRIFLYKVTRNFERSGLGDNGATIRGTMGALRLFGACPETWYKYNIANFDKEPGAFHYAFGQNYKAVDYYRLDLDGILLDKIKQHICQGIPIIFGMDVYENFDSNGDGVIPMPVGSPIGGHAVVIVGYDNNRLKFRNSWGTSWGANGYGWIPNEYLLYCSDFWVLTKMDYVSVKNVL
jgi:C1A family cysteine protease